MFDQRQEAESREQRAQPRGWTQAPDEDPGQQDEYKVPIPRVPIDSQVGLAVPT